MHVVDVMRVDVMRWQHVKCENDLSFQLASFTARPGEAELTTALNHSVHVLIAISAVLTWIWCAVEPRHCYAHTHTHVQRAGHH